MKKEVKYLLYLALPLVFIAAIFGYRAVVKEKEPNLTNKQGALSASKGRGSGGRGALPVSIHIAQYHTFDEGLLRIGNLVARERVDIVSEETGRVTQINFIEGDFVKRGDLLVKLNDDELSVQLTKAEYQYKLVEERLERQKILLEKDAVSRENYDQVLTEYNVLKQDIEQLKIRIEKMQIRAPFDGVVGFRDISMGAFLQPNSKITSLVDIANLIVEVAIPEKYVVDKLIGLPVDFTVEGLVDNFSALIYAIDPQIDVTTRTLMIRARYKNSDYRLRPGMSARVTVKSEESSRKVYLPNQAIVPDIKGRSVWVMKDGKANSVPVQTGFRTADMVEVLAGVEQGDTIITTGLMQLRGGMSVLPDNI